MEDRQIRMNLPIPTTVKKKGYCDCQIEKITEEKITFKIPGNGIVDLKIDNKSKSTDGFFEYLCSTSSHGGLYYSIVAQPKKLKESIFRKYERQEYNRVLASKKKPIPQKKNL